MSVMATRHLVLQALRGSEIPVSGEQLARSLNISRSAVWKAIRSLQAEGYRIDAAPNRGYRLTESPDIISEAEISRWLNQEELGSSMEIHGTLDSTNNRAKELASRGAPHGMLVAAETQTAGRGRFSRRFYSPPHTGVFISFILRPALPAERAAMVTSMAAVAVAQAIESLSGLCPGIKWVNDVIIGGKKCCGILCEASISCESGRLDYLVAGIGVNVGRMDFPPDLAEIATSVENESGMHVSRSRLIAEIANRMAALYGELESGAFMAESRSRSVVIGREITVLSGGEPYRAKALDIDDRGRLIILRADGTQEALNSGEISIRLLGKEGKSPCV